MIKFFLVFVGGGLGAMLRFFVTATLSGKLGDFPLGTLTANICGSFFMGLVMGVLLGKNSIDAENLRLFLAVGFLGGFTTFSSFSAETLTLLQHGQFFLAAMNIILSIAAGLLACSAGLTLSKI